MKGYIAYTEITKEILKSIQIGDLIKVNDWKKPMRVMGVSANYAVMVQKQFGKIYYSVIEKKPREAGIHNDMQPGCFHCGPDDWIFGDTDFGYKFDNAEAVAAYLQKFEDGINHLSERRGICIRSLQVKWMPRPKPGEGEEMDDRWNKTHCDRCHQEVKQGEGIYACDGFYHKDTCYREMQQDFIDAYEWDEYETFNEEEMVCPYCGYVGQDSFEYRDDEGERICGRCGKEFNYTREIEITYSTTPKEADNGR